MPIYRANGKTYDIPESKVSAFEKHYPDATVEVYDGATGKGYNIPVSKSGAFKKKFPGWSYGRPAGNTATGTEPKATTPKQTDTAVGTGSMASGGGSDKAAAKTTSARKDKQKAWRPTPLQKAMMINTVQSTVDQFKASSDALVEQNRNTGEYYRKGGSLTGTPVKGKISYDKESGKAEQTYLTPSGMATADKSLAERETRAYNDYMANMTVAGQLRRAGHDLEEMTQRSEARRAQVIEEVKARQREREKNRGFIGLIYDSIKGGDPMTSNQGGFMEEVNNALAHDTEYRALELARRNAQNRLGTIQRESDRQGGKDVGFWRGFGDVVGDMRTWDFGLGNLRDEMTKLGMSGKKPKAMSNAERMAMRQENESQEAERMYGDNDSFWYRAGTMTGEMLPFMLDFALSGGGKGGATAVTRGIDAFLLRSLHKAAPKIARNKAVQWATKALGAMPEELLYRAPLMTNTVQGMKTASDIMERKLGDVVVREDGTYDFSNDKTWGSAIWQGEANSIIENYSEMFGTHLDGLVSLNSLGKIADTFGAKRLSGVLARADKTGLGRIAETMRKQFNQLGVADYVGEVGEEYYGQLWRTMLNLDDAYKPKTDGNGNPVYKKDKAGNVVKDEKGNPVQERENLFFDGQFHGDIWGGMALSMGLMGAGKYTLTAAAYGSMKHRVNKADKFASGIFTPEVWDGWRTRIDGTPNAEVGTVAESIVADPTLTPEQKSAAMSYMEASLNLRGFNLGSVAKSRGGEQSAEEATANESYMDGYNATDPQEMNDTKRLMERERGRLASSLSEDEVAAFDDDPIGALARTEDPELRETAVKYVNAKAAYDGMIQRVRDDIDGEVSRAEAEIDGRTNRETGLLQPATLKGEDSREVYIVSGSVAMFDDGSGVDPERSSESVIIRDAETGKVEFADPLQIMSVGEAVDAEEAKASERERIWQENARASADRIDGVLDFGAGAAYSVLDMDGNPEDITILGSSVDENGLPVDGSVDIQYADGTIQSVGTENLQQWVDAANARRVEQFAEDRDAERAMAEEAEREMDASGLSNPHRDRSLLPDDWEMPYYGFGTTASRYIESDRGTGGMLYRDERGNDAIVVSAIDENNYVGYFREYDENGEPTNRWSAKFQNGSGVRENHRDMMETAQALLPAGHELTEHTNVSTDGLRNLANQLKHGYELQHDEDGNVITERVPLNMMAKENDLDLPGYEPGSEGNAPASFRDEAHRAEVISRLGQMLAPFGLDENAVTIEDGLIYVEHPVLRRADTPEEDAISTEDRPADASGATVAESAAERPADGTIETFGDGIIITPDIRLSEDEINGMLNDAEQQGVEPSANGENVQQSAPLQSALSQIPTDENGDAMYEAVDADLAWDGLMEETEDEQIAQSVIEQEIAEREEALKRISKQKPKAGLTTKEKIRAEKEKKQAMEDIQKSIDHWKRMSTTNQRRKAEEESKRREEERRLAEERRAEAERERAEREESERKEREALNGVPDWSHDTPQDARARGYRRFGPEKVDRQEPVAAIAGKDVEVKFGEKELPKGKAALIDVEVLQPSHIEGMRNPRHFIDEAQPKERIDAPSRDAARKIASAIRPEEITTSVTAFTGAPTVNSRGETIQGNSRSAALKLMYENEPEQAAKYRQYLIEHAEDFGLTAEQVEGIEKPVLVNILDASDDEAIRLGQFGAPDTESGGIERIKPKNTVKKMGEKIRSFANILLRATDDEASISQLVDMNGTETLKWMAQQGFISDTQYSSAFDSRGYLTGEAANDLKGILYQSIFTGGSTRLEEMFNTLPAKAQRGILATAFRDRDSRHEDRMLGEIQQSIIAFQDLSADDGFANAGNLKDAIAATETWKRQYAIDDVSGEPYLPSENFSNFALRLAAIYRGSSQKFIQQTLNDLFDSVQGTGEDTLFETADKEPKSLGESIRKVLDMEYKPIKPRENGENGGGALDVDTEESERGGSGSIGDTGVGERGSEESGNSERGGGTSADSGERSIAGDEVNLHPTEAQKEAGNYKKKHVVIDGMRISIENPSGSIRSGKDPDGNAWETKMTMDYGYIRGTTGKDKDHIDIFLSQSATDTAWVDEMELGSVVYVVDQYNKDGSFDEHKVVYGVPDAIQARLAYLENYSADWAEGRRIDVTEVPMDKFKAWAFDGRRKVKPFAEYSSVKKSSGEGQQEVSSASASAQAERTTKPEDGSKYDRSIPTTPDAQRSAISRIINFAKNIKDRVERAVIGGITKRQVKDFAKIGVDVDDTWVHSFESSAVSHNQKHHGNAKDEEARGQIAITAEDYSKIPDILEGYDRVLKSPNTAHRTGNEVLIYEKEFEDGYVYYLEEKRDNRKSLAFQTMYKKKKGIDSSDGLMQNAPTSTPKATPDNLDSNSEGKDNALPGNKQAESGKSSGEAQTNLTKGNSMVGYVAPEYLSAALDMLSRAPFNLTVLEESKLAEADAEENEGATRYREGDGSYSDTEVSVANDPWAKAWGENYRSLKQRRAYAERERERMRRTAERLSGALGVEIEVLEDAEGLTGRKRRAKGWYDKRTGKVTVVVSNHLSAGDMEATILHEAVAHHGLRELLGVHFDEFLDKVYSAAENGIKERIDLLATRNGWNRRVATEEYLAGLAEDMDFERAESETGGWLERIKQFFIDMLFKAGFKHVKEGTLSDNELRYVLWRSYQNLAHPGRYRAFEWEAEDVAMQDRLGVGAYSRSERAQGESSASASAQTERRVDADSARTERRGDSADAARGATAGAARDDAAGAEDSSSDGRPIDQGTQGSEAAEPRVRRRIQKDPGPSLFDWVDSKKDSKNDGASARQEEDRESEAANAAIDRYAESLGDFLRRRDALEESLSAEEIEDEEKDAIISQMESEEEAIAEERERLESILKDYYAGTGEGKEAEKKAREMAWRVQAEVSGRISGQRKLREIADFSPEDKPADATDESGVLFRDGDFTARDRALAADYYERMLSRGSWQFREAMQDSMLGLKALYEAVLTEGSKARKRDFRIEEVAGYENAYLYENRMSSANNGEQHEYFTRYMKPLLESIHEICGKDEAERRALTDYMMAKHGLERNAYMRAEAASNGEETERDFAGLCGLTGEDDWQAAEAAAQQMIDDYELDHDTSELWDRVRNATRATLDKIYMSGLISEETYTKVLGMYDHYIPLRGWDETTSDEVYGYLTSKDGPLLGSVWKHAEGRKSKAEDPIAYIAQMADDAIRQGNRNIMKQRFLNFAQGHPSDLVSVSELWLQHNDVTDEWEPVFADLEPDMTPEEVENEVRLFEEKMEGLAASEPDKYKRGRDARNIPYKVKKGNMREHQVLVKRNGRTYVMTINGNPRAAQALNGLTNPDTETGGVAGNMLKLGEYVNRNLSAFYTTRNPDFVVSNFLRDMLYSNAMTWVKENPRYALRFHRNFGRVNPARLRGLLHKWEKGELDESVYLERMMKEFMLNGGETGYTSVKDIEQHKRTIAAELRKQGSAGRKAWAALGRQLELLNRSAENCARFAAFLTSREMGRTLDRSIHDAKEISVNFNKKGAGGKFVNATGQKLLGKIGSYLGGGGRIAYVFWNAGMQGMTNFGRAGKRNPGKALAGAGALFTLGIAIPLLAQMLAGDGDDDDKNAYYNLPEYVRRSNICFKAGNQWITIPLPIEYRAIYGLGELATGVISGKERYSDAELARQLAAQVSQTMPLDMLEGGGGISPFIPSAFKPLIEAYIMNRGWTGLPVYKDTPFNKNDPEWTKAYASADQHLVGFARWLNETTGGDDYKKEKIDINPAKLEYLLNGTFGGVFSFPTKVKKSAETAFGDREFEWRNMPLANRVVKSGDERTANRKLREEYFKYKAEAEETGRLYRKYEDAAEDGILGYAERADFLYNSGEYLRYEIYKEYEPEMEAIQEELKEATGRDERKALEDEMHAAMRGLVDAIRASEK